MRRRVRFVVLTAAMGSLLCSAAKAADEQYSLTGPYAALGAAGGFSVFQGPLQNFGDSAGFSARGGYRFTDMLALEALYEYMDDFGSSRPQKNVLRRADIQTNHFSISGKVIAPTHDQLQPYLTVGVGFLNANGISDLKDEGGASSHTEFAGRFGGGVDLWFTPNIAAYVDAAYVVPTSKLGDIQYVALGGGIKYSFGSPEAPPPRVAQAPPPKPAPPTKKKIVLRGVHFDFNKATIRPDARPILNEAVAILKREGGVAVIAEGHTDSIGTEAYNQKLSVQRAKAVRDYLVAAGIKASRVRYEGFGESHPVASNDTADGRAQNRRVELRVRGN